LYRGHDTAEGRKAIQKPLDILDAPDLAYFSDGWDRSFNATLVDDVPQELAPKDPKGALFWVLFDVETPEVGEGFLYVEDKITTLLGLHDDVIDVDPQVAPDLSLKAGLHTPLLGGPAFFNSNGIFA
jgi:hypothetical protein